MFHSLNNHKEQIMLIALTNEEFLGDLDSIRSRWEGVADLATARLENRAVARGLRQLCHLLVRPVCANDFGWYSPRTNFTHTDARLLTSSRQQKSELI